MSSLRRMARVLAAISILFLLFRGAPAQTTAGRILGSISDQTGAAVVGAQVTITDVQHGTSRSLVTTQTGDYVAPDLPAGSYKVRAEAKGFKTIERVNIELEVGKDARIDLVLSPGLVSETLVIEEDAPLVDATSATLGGTLSNKEINDLPLNGRNYENLLQLRPGVMRYPGGGFSTTSANGLRAEDNAYLVEGLFNSEPYSGQAIINGAGIAGDSATILPIDSIQEFNLQQNPPAEYGWKPGAVVNVGLKSGTNKLHGTAFAFGRDGAMDARNFFNTAPNPKLPRTLEQFGGSLGGPIIKDKAFFFGAYEGQLYDVGNSFGGVTSPSMVSLPTPSTPNCLFGTQTGDCANSIPDVIADLQAGGITVSPASLQVAGCAFSGAAVTCNGKGFPTNNSQSISITNGFNNDVRVQNFVGKVDYRFNDRHSISGMYFFGNNRGTVEDFPELQSFWRSRIHTRAQVAGGPERSLGKRSAIWLQPALSTDAAGRSQYTCFSLRSGHRREWSVYGRTAADWLRRLLLPGPRRFQVAEIPGTRYDHAVPGPHLLHCGQARPEVRWGDPPRRRQECCLREFEGQHYVSWRYLESRFNPVGGFFCRFPV